MTKIDVSKFLTQSEFKDGLQVSASGEVSAKIDATEGSDSKKFLYIKPSATEGENGAIALSGISEAIAAAAASAKTVVASEDESVVVTPTTSGTDSHVAYDLHADGGTIKVATAVVSGEGATFIETGKTMDESLQAIVNEIIDNEETEAAAIAAIQEAAGLNENLGYDTPTSATYISGATDISEALVQLDTAIKNTATSAITVTEGNGITITSEGTVKTISAKVMENDPMIGVDENGIRLLENWTLDCGEY